MTGPMPEIDLFSPGAHRAGRAFTSAALVAAMTRVEAAWASTLELRGKAPAGTAEAVAGYTVDQDTMVDLEREAELAGNALIPLLARLRDHTESSVPGGGRALHLGLTSQDVIDSALVLLAREASETVLADVERALEAIDRLIAEHGDVPLLGRTLGRPAMSTTFGVRVLGWRQDFDAAREELAAWNVEAPLQLGGAVGDRSTISRALASSDSSDVDAAVRSTAQALGLRPAEPWHTSRAPVVRYATALTTTATACGHLANDVARQSRPEVGELSEPAAPGRGVSSAMGDKKNPVLSILLRRTALQAPLLLAQVQLAAAGSVEERADGAWQAEWAPLRDLSRRVLAAGSIAAELLEGLVVDAGRMAENARAARGDQ